MEFKEFIYYNTDFIRSFVAQVNDGIIHKTQTESGKKVKGIDGKSITTTSPSFIGKAGLSEVIGGSVNFGGKSSNVMSVDSNSDSIKEITQKIMDDNIFANMISHLDCKTDQDTLEYNDFVLINQDIKIFDIVSYSYLLGEGLPGANEKITKREMKNQQSSMNRSKKRSKAFNNRKKQIENEMDEYRENAKLLSSMLDFLANILPSPIFLKANDIFIPVEEKYFRVLQKTIPYKFKNPTTLLGRVVGEIGSSDEFDFTGGSMIDMNQSISELRREAFNTFGFSSKSLIVMPIAWYSTYEIELNQ